MTRCCGTGIVTRTHDSPSWHTCAGCGQYVTIAGVPLATRPDGRWSCILDHVAVPCGRCGGCRQIIAENRADGIIP